MTLHPISGKSYLFPALLLVLLCATLCTAQTAVVLSPAPQAAFIDQNGNALSFGCVFTYQSQSTTQLATYGDQTGSNPNPNPVILNAAGVANIWLQAGQAYTFVVKSSGGTNCALGQTIYSVDGVGGGASQLTTVVTPSGGTASFTTQSQNQLFTLTLTGNVVAQPLTFSGVSSPALITFQITEDAAGTHTFIWPANMIGTVGIDTTANHTTSQTFIWNGSTVLPVGDGFTSLGNALTTRLNGVRVATNFPGAELGAQITAAIADCGGACTIYIPAGAYTMSSTVAVINPATSIRGAGSQATIITCTQNADCFNVRTTPFTISPGFGISGLSIIGTGSSNANAVGIHTGDMVGGHFEDLQIDNFLGTTSSCFWADNQSGWWERNLIENVELGIHGETQSGCTKELRFTVNGGDTSFGYNDFYGLRLSPAVSGQIGISIEGTSSFYKEVLVGNANMVPGTTLISASGSANGNGNFINLRVECTILGGCAAGSATGWSISSASVNLHYAGPGIVTGGDPALVNLVTQPEVLVSEYSVDKSSFRPDIAGQETFRLNTLSTTPGQINESIGLSNADVGGFGGVVGSNIQHPIVWGYSADSNCFEAYVKTFQTPLTSSNRIATLPCGKGTSTAEFGLIIAKGTAAMGTGALASLACGDAGTLTVTGGTLANVAATDRLTYSFQGTDVGALILTGATGSGAVTIRYCNPLSTSATPASATVSWAVTR